MEPPQVDACNHRPQTLCCRACAHYTNQLAHAWIAVASDSEHRRHRALDGPRARILSALLESRIACKPLFLSEEKILRQLAQGDFETLVGY